MTAAPVLQNISEEAAEHVRIWAVDTCCLVPMRLSPKAHMRAYTYRTQSQKLLQERQEGMPYQNADSDWAALLKGVTQVCSGFRVQGYV